MEYTTMVLPSSLLEEEDELLSVGILRGQPTFELPTNDQPFTRTPRATLYSGGQGYNGHPKLGDTSYTPKRSW
jgi:hypothetical protein